jgi:acetate---CoA ligase (ADP-forming)
MIKVLNEFESEKIVSKYLKTVKNEDLSVENFQDAKIKSKFPIYIKIMSPLAVHKVKSKAIFKIETTEEFEKLKNKIEKRAKELKAKKIIIQEEIEGEDIIIGINKDTKFGFLLMLGIGGKHAEEIHDVSFRKIPVEKKEIENMINDLTNQAIIKRINKNALISAMYKIQKAIKIQKLKTLDLNPIKVNEKEAIVVDARIYLE